MAKAMLLLLTVFGAGCDERASLPSEVSAFQPANKEPPDSVRAPLDLGPVMDRVRYAFRPSSSGYAGKGYAHSTLADARDLTLTPTDREPHAGARQEACEGSSFRLRVERGGRAGGPALEPVTATSLGVVGELRKQRGSVTEILTNRADGVEQSFSFAAPPRGYGDYTIELAVSGQTYRGETAGGLHFEGSRHGLGVRYSHGRFIDANGRETHVPARWTGSRIELRLPAALLATAAFPALLDPTIGPEFGLDQPVPTAGTEGQNASNSAVASNADGRSLVVWSVGGDVWATRLDPGGVILDPVGLEISRGPGAVGGAVAASDGSGWLVAYEGGGDVLAKRITSAGSVDSAPIVVSSAANSQGAPAVAFNGTDWLVVWQDGRSTSSDIYGTRVTTSGTVLSSDGIAISTATRGQGRPAVGSDGSSWLVAWEDSRNVATNSDIYGTRVNESGTVLNPSGFVISNASNTQSLPSVSFSGIAYLVAWKDGRAGTEYRIYGARVSAAGGLLDSGGIQLSGATNPSSLVFDDSGPATSSDGTNWLAVWPQIDGTVHATRVSPAGSVLDGGGVALPADRAPALAYDGSTFVLTWTEGNGGAADAIRATRVDSNLQTLDTTGILLSPTTNEQLSAAVAENGTNFLVVWTDYRSGEFADIYGTRVAADGTVLDPLGIAISGSAGTGRSARVASDGDQWLVTWTDYRDGFTPSPYAARVSAAGTVLDPDGILLSGESPEPQAVAFDGYNWLVTWFWGGIQGTRVSTSGVVLDPTGLAIATTIGSGAAITVAGGGGASLVAWSENVGGSSFDLLGTRVGPAGDVLDAEPFAIATGADEQAAPALAFDGTNWLAVWNDLGAAREVRGARIDASGTVLDSSPIAVSGVGPENEELPVVVYDGTYWFSMWTRARTGTSEYDVYAARIDADGAVVDDPALAISTGDGIEEYPALASLPNGTLLAAYHTRVGADSRIEARIIQEDCVPQSASDATCDGIDDDCNGVADEDHEPVATSCGSGGCAATGVTSCVAASVHDSCAPDPTDTDADGVPNCADACPVLPGDPSDGCPASGSSGAAGSSGSAGQAGAGGTTSSGGTTSAGGLGGGQTCDGGSGASAAGNGGFGSNGAAGVPAGGVGGTAGGSGEGGISGEAGEGGMSGGPDAAGGSDTGGTGAAAGADSSSGAGQSSQGGEATEGGESGRSVGGDGGGAGKRGGGGGRAGSNGIGGFAGRAGASAAGTGDIGSPPPDGSCSCRVPAKGSGGGLAWLIASLLGVATRFRRGWGRRAHKRGAQKTTAAPEPVRASFASASARGG